MRDIITNNSSFDLKGDSKTLAIDLSKAVFEAAKEPLKDFLGGLVETGINRLKEYVEEKISKHLDQ